MISASTSLKTKTKMINPDKEISKDELLGKLNASGRFSNAELEKIAQAFDFGSRRHEGQQRASGKNYFEGHCTHIAWHLNELEAAAATVVAGLLHETLDETETTTEELAKEFGPEIAFLVERVSELGHLKYRHYRRHVSSLRRFFVTVAGDVRVIIIKLCDRYHNLQTLQYIPQNKWRRIAEESMLVHAQLAQKLNMTQLQQSINDTAFPYVFPEDCQRVKKLQASSLAKAEKVIEATYARCSTSLKKELGYAPTIDRRVKTAYSLYKKLKAKDWDIDSVYDIVALRVIVRNIKQCYQALGVIHASWQPVTSRFKDYIATPKANGYRSLHTTIVGEGGMMVEIQIKTLRMHKEAEFGDASHLSYKSIREKELGELDSPKSQFDWLEQLSITGGGDQPGKLKHLKTDFFADRIFVMTPNRDVIDLPEGATVLDFAFAVHTDLGLNARGGLINGVYKALKTPLANRDVVEIVTDKKIFPQASWLDWVKTPSARDRIKAFLKNQRT